MAKEMRVFAWTPEKIRIATNMVKAEKCAKDIMEAVGCSKKCAYKFIRTISPTEIDGEFREFILKKKGPKKSDR